MIKKSTNQILRFILLFFLTFSIVFAQTTKEKIIERLEKSGLSAELVVLLVAMLPIIELRGAIPIGINFYHLVWYKAVILAIIGNMLPIFLIIFLLDKIAKVLSKIKIFEKFFAWLFARTRRKSKIIEEYETIGLMIFVAIPLPMTGAWTGAVAAFLLGLKYLNALMAIFFGVLIAAVVVTTLSLLGIWGAIIAGIALTILAITSIWGMFKRRQS
ncbi:MAG: small multi-drug export protein [candidate division WOR-3 bacterium]